jgi:hypothetical protein
MDLRSIIRGYLQELDSRGRPVATDAFGVERDRNTNWGRNIERMYFEKGKILSLIHRLIKRYGHAKVDDHGVKATYDRILTAIQNDPQLETVEVDQEFVDAFMTALNKREILVGDPMLAAKATSSLHGSRVLVGNLHTVAKMVHQYELQLSKMASRELETEKPTLFYKLRLQKATYDGFDRLTSVPMSDRNPPERGSCWFKDQANNWYKKMGAPPAIHMRVDRGKGKILTYNPYEMRLGDVYTFRGRVARTYTDAKGFVINVIDGVQPL